MTIPFVRNGSLFAILFAGLWPSGQRSVAQTGMAPQQVYSRIADTPSKGRWCTPEAGDDPASIIATSCRSYDGCLDDLKLDRKVDSQPYPVLSPDSVEGLRRCHQALFNAARVNPQIKGSKATQDWLLHALPMTEAKTFPVPSSMTTPR